MSEAAAAAPPKPYGAYAILWIGGAMLAVAILLGMFHGYEWLRYGAITPYSTAWLFADIGIGYPRVSWIGVQNVIDWIMHASAGFVLFFTGLLLCWWAGLYTDEYQKEAWSYQSKQRLDAITAEREAKNAEVRAREARKAENRARRDAERQASQ